MNDNKTIHLGITMAGAISAGAYTAGVLDYLFEVLEKWELMKTDPQFRDKVPQHNVVIDVMSGASAGGMTACIASLAVQRLLFPITTFCHKGESYDPNVSEKEITLRKGAGGKGKNRFYDAWVNLNATDMVPEMLKVNDGVKIMGCDSPGYISALNSNFIRDVAHRTLTIDRPEIPTVFPPFVSDRLKTFVTLANLDGFKRSSPFAGGDGSFFMYDHRDLALFAFRDEPGLRDKGVILVDLTKAKEQNTQLFLSSAIATGAFPIGLAYQMISRHRDYIEKNILLAKLNGGHFFPLNEDDVGPGGIYTAPVVDGGTLDNEPFELTEFLLSEQVGADFRNEDFSDFNSTILMIDPFPSENRDSVEYDPRLKPLTLFGAAGSLFGTLRTQSMLKPEELTRALRKEDPSRYLISPKRGQGAKALNGSRAIACGSLGGFGGFLDKDFRRHDFYLGRINCRSFLARHFSVPASAIAENPVFESYQDKAVADAFAIQEPLVPGEEQKFSFPIIPDINKLIDPRDIKTLYAGLKFPKKDAAKWKIDFSEHEAAIFERLRGIVRSELGSHSGRAFAAGLAMRAFKPTILRKVTAPIYASLTDWGLL